MYEAKFLGKVVRLTWQELRSLKARFNTKNFKKIREGLYRNKRGCILCDNYCVKWFDCKECPMATFPSTPGAHGCIVLMKKMLKVKETKFECRSKDLEFYDEQGRNNIEKISVFLERFKKV